LRLSIPRFAKAAAAISLVSVPLVAFAAPAFADQPPNARPAMNGAQPRSRPVTPPTPNNMTILMHQLGGDAMFSVATLAVLLVPITGYGVLIRQRERREESEAAERSERAAAASGMPPDPLLEFFAPLQPRPAEPPSAAGPSAPPRFQPRPGLTGRSTLSTPLSGRSAFTPSPQPSAQKERSSQERLILASSAGEPTASSPHTIQVAGIGSDSVRRTETSGTPPWEPASRPTTELPWAVISASGSARTAGAESSSPTIPPPPDSVWDSSSAPAQRSSAPRSLFEPTPPPPPRSSQPRDADAAPRQAPPQPPQGRQPRPGPPQLPQGRQSRQGPTQPPPSREPREAAPQPSQGRQPRQGPTQPPPGRQPQGRQPQGRQTQPRQAPQPRQQQPRQNQPRQAQPPGQPKRVSAQSRRGGSATPPVPAPMPAPVPQPTSWEDLPQSDLGQAFVWNPVSEEFPANDRIGDLPRRNNRRGKH